RPQGPRAGAQARPALRHHVDVVLSVAPLAAPPGSLRYPALAGPAVHCAGALRQRRHGLLPNTDRPGGGGGYSGDSVAERNRSKPLIHRFLLKEDHYTDSPRDTWLPRNYCIAIALKSGRPNVISAGPVTCCIAT